MLYLHPLSEDDIHTAIAKGEFPEHIRTAADNVAIIATQDWCPEWKFMQRWMERETAAADSSDTRADTPDVAVFTVIYNKTPYQESFMRLKEDTWKSTLIPYVRYYRNGRLIDDTNRVSRDAFYQRFQGEI